MKIQMRFVTFLCSFLLITPFLKGQNCPYDPSLLVFDTNNQTIDNASSIWQQTETNLGNCNAYYVIAGNTYEWSLCDADGANFASSASINAVKENIYLNPIFEPDFFVGERVTCGGKPKIIYTADFTGYIYVQVLTGSCTNGAPAPPFDYIPVPVGLRYRTYNCATVTAGVLTSPSSNICQGNSVQLSVVAAPGTAVQWQLNGTDIAFGNSNTYFANTPGVYTATVSLLGSACAAAPTNATTLNAATANISYDGLPAICNEQPKVLLANTGTELTYEWRYNGSIIPGATLPSFSATLPGQYNVKIVFQECTSQDSVMVTSGTTPPSPLIIPLGVTTFCIGENVVLDATSLSGYNYQWEVNDLIIPGATYNTFQADSSGSYSLVILNTAGCGAASNSINVVEYDCSAGLNEAQSTASSIYPNPTSDFLTIQIPENQNLVSVSVMDTHGRVILRQPVNSSSHLLKLSVNNLATGFYFLQIVRNNSTSTSKFFKAN